MLVRIDGLPATRDALWWPSMNFDQFRWDKPIGNYELTVPRAEVLRRLRAVYDQCVSELRADDRVDPAHVSPLRQGEYPPLEKVLDIPAARLELFSVYMWDDLYSKFIPHPPSSAARFMVNSLEEVAATDDAVIIRGRGYHASPVRS